MMLYSFRRYAPLLGCLAVLSIAAPAAAQISGSPVSLPARTSGRNSIAFDSVNQVYLVIQAGHPIGGKFLNKSGAEVVGAFPISDWGEAPYTGWASVAFGGTSSDPTFILTYVANEGASCIHSKFARLVRFRPGQSPSVSARTKIADIGCEWPSAEKAQTAWNGSQFVIGTRIPAAPFPQPAVSLMNLAGVVTNSKVLGDFLDYYGSPALACSPNGTVCMISGYANGVPVAGALGGSYARLFNGQTLAELTGMFYVDDHSARMEDQRVIYNTATQQFLAAWWRAGYADTRVVNTAGGMGALRKNAVGGFAGDLALAFNAGTQSSVLVTKLFPADLYAVELNGDGVPVGSPVLITAWDGVWPEFTPAIAANNADRQWLAVAVQNNGGRALLVQGQGGGPPPVPSNAAVHDLGGDGSTDLLFRSFGDGALAVWNLSGNAVMSTYLINQGHGVDLGWQVAGAGDVNGDGFADLIWRHPATGILAVWYLQGPTIMKAEHIILNGQPAVIPDPGWEIRGVGDLNGDGKSDLVWQHKTTGALAAWFLNGFTVLSTQLLSIPYVGDTGWRIVGAADINKDGRADLVWQHVNGLLFAWLMNGAQVGTQAPFSIYGVPNLTWEVRGVGDTNGDGFADLLWYNTSTGRVAVWYLNGFTVAGQQHISLPAPSGWQVVGPG